MNPEVQQISSAIFSLVFRGVLYIQKGQKVMTYQISSDYLIQKINK